MSDFVSTVAGELHDMFAGRYLRDEEGDLAYRLDARDVPGLPAVDVTLYGPETFTAVLGVVRVSVGEVSS